MFIKYFKIFLLSLCLISKYSHAKEEDDLELVLDNDVSNSSDETIETNNTNEQSLQNNQLNNSFNNEQQQTSNINEQTSLNNQLNSFNNEQQQTPNTKEQTSLNNQLNSFNNEQQQTPNTKEQNPLNNQILEEPQLVNPSQFETKKSNIKGPNQMNNAMSIPLPNNISPPNNKINSTKNSSIPTNIPPTNNALPPIPVPPTNEYIVPAMPTNEYIAPPTNGSNIPLPKQENVISVEDTSEPINTNPTKEEIINKNTSNKLPTPKNVDNSLIKPTLSSSKIQSIMNRAKQLKDLAIGEAPEEYTIKAGDTLWDISDQILNNPNWWPKLWALNPHIENPNILEIGEKIKFYGNIEEGQRNLAGNFLNSKNKFNNQSDIDEVFPIAPDALAVTKFVNLVNHPWQGQEGAFINHNELALDNNVLVSGNPFVSPTSFIQLPGFLSNSSPDFAGKILDIGEKRLIGTINTIFYADFNEMPKIGEKFITIRPSVKAKYATNNEVGDSELYLYTGIVNVIGIDKNNNVKILVENTQRGIFMTDYLIPYKNIFTSIDTTAKSQLSNIKATIVAAGEANLATMSSGQCILLEKEEGNVNLGEDINIYMSPNGVLTDIYNETLEFELRARARVIDIGERYISAIVLPGSKELSIGARTWH